MKPRIDLSLDGCTAVFHPAEGSRGAIICAGHGYDELCTYRNFALLSDDLAEAGVPTLRFDYHGTGNSLGDDADPARIETWLANIAAAIAWMRGEVGVEEIALVGYRLGGMLATMAASRDLAIKSLVLIAPVIAGRSYIRELQLQSQLYPVKDDAAGDEGGVSVAGFRLSHETVSVIKPVNLVKTNLPSLDRALILDDLVGQETPFVTALSKAGATVTCRPFPALAALTVDPIRSLSVEKPFDLVIPFLVEGRQRSNPSAAMDRKPAQLLDGGWIETRFRFGPQDRLFGIWCEPVGSNSQRAILFVNGGANRNTGWARMTVGLARTLASMGIASFRIDLTGLGESRSDERRPQPILYADEFQEDVSTALDWLATRGITHITAFGACSGAQTIFESAVKDARVDAVIMVNLLRFDISAEEAARIGGAPTFRSTANYLQRMGDLASWKRLIRGGRTKLAGLVGEYARRMAIATRSQLGYIGARVTRRHSLGGPVYRKFARLGARNARILIVYSDVDDGLGELAIHVGRRGRMLKGVGDVSIVLISDTDHNLTSRTSQAKLAALVVTFMGREESAGLYSDRSDDM